MTFADLGASVAVLDWTAGAAAATAKKIEAMGRRAVAFEGDAGNEKTVVEAFEAIKRTLGPVDVAVACAGVLGAGGPIFTPSVDDFETVMGVNVEARSCLCARPPSRCVRVGLAHCPLSSLDGLQAEHGCSRLAFQRELFSILPAAALDLARDWSE